MVEAERAATVPNMAERPREMRTRRGIPRCGPNDSDRSSFAGVGVG